MTAIESRWYADDRARGVGYAVVGVTVAVLPGVVLRRLVGSQAAAAVASALAFAGAMLEREPFGLAFAAGCFVARNGRLLLRRRD